MASYIPIRIGTLVPGSVDFDVFVQVGERHVHYIRLGDEIEGDRIKKLREKGVKKMFITEDSEPDYLNYLDRGLDQLGSATATKQEKGEVTQTTLQMEARNAEKSFDSEKTYQRTEERISKIVDFLHNAEGALSSVLDSSGFSESVDQHASNVASISLSLATRLGVYDTDDLMALAMGALTHDIGKRDLTFDPLKPMSEMSSGEKETYRKHPDFGVQVLAEKKLITPRILALIANHEEIGHGTGYPNRLVLKKQVLPCQILNLCNHFDRYVMDSKLKPFDAIQKLRTEKQELFDPTHMEALEKILSEKGI